MMRRYRAIKPRFKGWCIKLLVVVSFILSIYFSVNVLVNRYKPYIIPQTIITTTQKDGIYSPYVYRTKGLMGLLGKMTGLLIGGDFTGGESIVSTVTGNISYDKEKETVIDIPTPQPTPTFTPTPITGKLIERSIKAEGGNTKIDKSISINNETKYNADENELNKNEAPFKFAGKPEVLIVHTHATESFQPTEKIDFGHTSVDRSTDTKYNMVAVGDELTKELESQGVGVVHLRNLYDYPDYNSAYARSCKDVETEIKKYPSIRIVIDLHRDAITDKAGNKTKLTCNINNEKVAQVMIVVGTDELGLKHDKWRTNLKFAVDLQKEFLTVNSGFARPINLRTSRFNGHTAPGAIIIECGSAANNIEEAFASTKHIATAIKLVITNYDKPKNT